MIKTYISLICLVLLTGGGFAAHYFYPERVNSVLSEVDTFHHRTNVEISNMTSNAVQTLRGVRKDVFDVLYNAQSTISDEAVERYDMVYNALIGGYDDLVDTIDQGQSSIVDFATSGYLEIQENVNDLVAGVTSRFDNNGAQVHFVQMANNSTTMNDANLDAVAFNNIEPAVGGDYETPPTIEHEFEMDQASLNIEAVLVPREKTVISSSRDGKLKAIYFKNGDRFKKGDILLEYHCDDLRAEWDAAHSEKRFARQKQLTTSRLFDLELASHLEKLQSSVENKQSTAKQRAMESRLKDCVIKADYNGRVVKKMANASEYTRTDRVLMEVASEGALDMEFLLPSIWLRWVNVGAPLTLTLTETGRDYTAVVTRIYGEVDPVSQSIQVRAQLDGYDEPLLPGMSGQAQVHIDKMREAGISGFLEAQVH
jgi:membrane fusion protein (multidrug efflux system)